MRFVLQWKDGRREAADTGGGHTYYVPVVHRDKHGYATKTETVVFKFSSHDKASDTMTYDEDHRKEGL